MINIFNTTLIVLIGAGAGFVQRVSGFGLTIFAMMFLPYLMPTSTSAAVACLISCYLSTYNAVKYRKEIPFKKLFPVIISSLITIPIAIYFSPYISDEAFKVILGVCLIIISLYFLFFSNSIKIKATMGSGLIIGTVSGALNGFFSTGGPPVVLYLTCAHISNIAYFSATQCFFSITNIYATISRILNGIITQEIVIYSIIGLIGCVLGNFIGRCVFNKLDPRKLKRIIYIGMVVSGVSMLL